MTADLFVVHLVSRGVAGARSGWDTPNGTVRHEVVSWSRSPATLGNADIVVAHGLAPLVVAQAIVGAGPRLVFRPVGATRANRRRLQRGLRADWIAAPSRRIGRSTASAMGLDRSRVTVMRSDDRASWDSLTTEMLDHAPAPTNGERPPVRALDPIDVPRLDSPGSDGPPLDVSPLDVSPLDVPVVRSSRLLGWTFGRLAPSRARATDPDVGAGLIGPAAAERVGPEPAIPSSPVPLATPAAPPIRANGIVAPIVGRESVASVGSPSLGVGVVDPTSPGQPWWRYRRLDVPRGAMVAGVTNGSGDDPDHGGTNGAALPPVKGPPPVGQPPAAPGPAGGDAVQLVDSGVRSGVGFFAIGAVLLAIVAGASQTGTIGEGPFLIPVAGLFFAMAAARRIARTHPEEAWAGTWLVWGFVAKLLASYFRYYTLIHTYNGLGDAADYDNVGRQYARHWLNGTPGPKLYTPGLRKTNFVRWFTGVTYYAFGSKLLTGTFVFALLALIGSYLWYRATADSVPFVDRRVYLGFVLFAPSIVFWPSIVGKEALMQFGLGVVAFGASYLLRQRLATGLLISLAGGWLVWVVRPHLLALVAIAAGAAYLAGRVRKSEGKAGLLTRPLGIIIIAFLVSFTIAQGAQFLGISSLSVSSIQAELNATTASTSQGGSHFQHGTNSLSPLAWPQDAVTVFLRPFPWEVESSLQILASLESAALAALIVWRFKSLRVALARSREAPFLMLCWVLTGLYAITFASFANFGLLVRERSLVLPALLVLLSVDPLKSLLQSLPPPPDLPAEVPDPPVINAV